MSAAGTGPEPASVRVRGPSWHGPCCSSTAAAEAAHFRTPGGTAKVA